MAVDTIQPKRPRLDDDGANGYDVEDDDYTPYVPVKKRREAQLAKLAGRHALTDKSKLEQELEEADLAELERAKQRIKNDSATLLMEAQEVQRRKALEGVLSLCFPYSKCMLIRLRKMRKRPRWTRSERRRRPF